MEVTINVHQYLIASGTLMALISIAILYMAIRRGVLVLSLSVVSVVFVWMYWVGSHSAELANIFV